jgi:tetraacyldisaccharide 4'-kinase
MRNIIIRVWNGEAIYMRWALYVPLAFFSYLYQIGLYVREYMYKSGHVKVEKAAIPVVSVGNITLGGTGKTPVVEKLSQRLKEEGLNPGIITRGYKRKKKGVFAVDIKNHTAKDVGDEAFMLAKKTHIPVIVGKDRLAAIDSGICSSGIDIAILDDGFQVKNLKKDVELLVLNGNEPLKNHELFPLGPYREPLIRVRDAHVVLINKGNLDESALYFTRAIPKFNIRYKPLHLYNIKRNLIAHYNFSKGKRVVAFSGLGDNRSFFNLLRAIGADVVHEVHFPDHHRYTQRDLEECASFKNTECIITTEKDAVKIANMDVPENLFYLSIEAVIEDENKLIELLLKKIGIQPRRFLNAGLRGQGQHLIQ